MKAKQESFCRIGIFIIGLQLRYAEVAECPETSFIANQLSAHNGNQIKMVSKQNYQETDANNRADLTVKNPERRSIALFLMENMTPNAEVFPSYPGLLGGLLHGMQLFSQFLLYFNLI